MIVSLYLTFALTVVIAGYLAGQPNHFVGGNLLDAEGGAVFGWARDGGDLRAAHFFALPAMHFVPAFAVEAIWSLAEAARRRAVLAFAAIYAAFTVYVFVEALMGRPFLGGAILGLSGRWRPTLPIASHERPLRPQKPTRALPLISLLHCA